MHLNFTLVALIWAVVSYLIYAVLSALLLKRRNAAKARMLKCEEPPWQESHLPLGIDIIKSAIQADREKRFPLELIRRREEVGADTFKYSVMGTTSINTVDEKNIQAILATQFSDFDLGPTRRGNFFPLLGNGIFTQDGKAWEHSRAMMRPQFARDQVSDLELEERHVQNMMQALDATKDSSGWTNCDLQVLFFRLTLDSAAEFLFGKSVDSQIALIPGSGHAYTSAENSADINSIDFAKAFDDGQMSLATRTRFSDKYWLVNPKGFKDACRSCHEFIDHFVRLALSKPVGDVEKKEDGGKKKYVFLEALVLQTRDPIELRSQLLHILLAGRDTTASLLGWLFMCISKDSVRYMKLRATIINEFGTYENPEEITYAKLKGCKYLQQCLSEALRLYPVVPVNGRYANKDTTLPRGGGKDRQSKVFVPKGTQVDYSVHVMHRRKDLWGLDADEFIPERWEGRKVGWEYIPFNGGPRICIGQSFATIEASMVTVRLLQRYDKMESTESDPVIKHNLTLTNCSANGVKVKAHEASCT